MGGRRAAGNNDLQKLAAQHNWYRLRIKGAFGTIRGVRYGCGLSSSTNAIDMAEIAMMELIEETYKVRKQQLEIKP